jgi:hypothetical protein
MYPLEWLMLCNLSRCARFLAFQDAAPQPQRVAEPKIASPLAVPEPLASLALSRVTAQ